MKEKISEFFKNIFNKEPKKIKGENTINDSFLNTGLDETYLFDFKNYSSGYRGSSGFVAVGGWTNDADIPSPTDSSSVNEVKTIKLGVKPKDVLHELETVPTPFSLNGIDEKIKVLEDKSALITQIYAKREVNALIERLKNRKQYIRYKSFFSDFQNTTDEKIDVLLTKYDLVMQTSDLFVPEFPDEAIKIMTLYTKKMEALCGKKPVFYVIAEKDRFRKAYEKRDPILLVQSPFGFYWQILGAWDEELILLSEL